jgi:hypothetical protein
MADAAVEKRLVELAQGVLVEEDVLGVVQRIMEYDSNLRVKYLDPTSFPDMTDAPYRIFELCPDGMERVVMSVWKLDERVLERLYKADNLKHGIFGEMNKRDELARRGLKRRFQDEIEALSEMAADVLRSPKDTYTATNPVTGEKHTFRASPQSER